MIAPFALFRGAGGILLFLLGIYVASLRPRRRENVAFSAFCALSGAGFATALFAPADPDAQALVSVGAGILFLAAGIALGRVALAFPGALAPGERPLARNAAILCLVLAIVQGGSYVMRNLADPTFATERIRMGALVEDIGLTAFRAAAWFGSLLAALRLIGKAEGDAGDTRAHVLFVVALAIYPAVHGPHHALDGAWDLVIGTTSFLMLLLLAGLLLRANAMTRSGSAARWAAWALLGASAAQLANRSFLKMEVSPNSVSIVAMFAILAYAMLNHQLLGMDVKLRFAISKSTIAAAFIAVFFIASEVAQEFFGDTLGSTYVGIAAAGALVFAMAPLQRVAERLADRAVPSHAPSALDAGAASNAREDHYRVVLRRFLSGAAITREEERALAQLAAELRIDAGRAYDLREEIERGGDAG